MRAKERLTLGMLAAVTAGAPVVARQGLDRRQLERIERALREEGEAVVALAETDRQSAPADFPLEWHNDFLKAQAGTFIPFIVTVGPGKLKSPAALVYVRAARRPASEPSDRTPKRPRAGVPLTFPFEEMYPVDLSTEPGPALRLVRGFSLAPGDYDLTVVVRERDRELEREDRGRKRLAAVHRRPLTVPDFSTGELAASTVILADRLTLLPEPPTPHDPHVRPYLIAGREIRPAVGRPFSPRDELIVVLLVYNPTVTPDKQFDLEVEYHFFRTTGEGDVYVNRTEPQRFTPASLGPDYDPSTGHPVLAGQGVPLAGFQDGDYRLAIKVTDRTSGRSIGREARFTVRSS